MTSSELSVSGAAAENPNPIVEKEEGHSKAPAAESLTDDSSVTETSQGDEEPIVTFKTWIVVFVCVFPSHLHRSRF